MQSKPITERPLNVLIINCDWRNIFETGFDELYKKLERDQLEPEKNSFFFLSWSNLSYFKRHRERFTSVHIKTRWRFFRPFLDIMSVFMVPYYVFKYKLSPDIIIVYDLGFVISARIVKLLRRSKVVLCLTNMPEIYSKTRRFGRIKSLYSSLIEHAFVRLVDVGYTINQTMKNYMVKTMGISEQKIVIFASNTILRDIKHIKASQKGTIRKKYSIKTDQKIILSIGRLETEKGFPRLLEIFSKLSSSLVLVILGSGSMESELKALTRKLGISKRIIFTGFVDRTGIWDYYQDADLFILLSNAEALGLVFWEAMYMGVPAIGSTAGGIVESLGQNGERGLIVEPNELIDSIKKKIDFALTEGPERDVMLLKAKSYVEHEIANNITINSLV